MAILIDDAAIYISPWISILFFLPSSSIEPDAPLSASRETFPYSIYNESHFREFYEEHFHGPIDIDKIEDNGRRKPGKIDFRTINHNPTKVSDWVLQFMTLHFLTIANQWYNFIRCPIMLLTSSVWVVFPLLNSKHIEYIMILSWVEPPKKREKPFFASCSVDNS